MSKAKQPVLNSKTYDITNTNVVQTEGFETPWFFREQLIQEYRTSTEYKGYKIEIHRTNIKPPYVATITSQSTKRELQRQGGENEAEALKNAQDSIDSMEAQAPTISSDSTTSILFNTLASGELLKDPSIYNDVYAKIDSSESGPILVIGNETYGADALSKAGFKKSSDRRPVKQKTSSEESMPQVMFPFSGSDLKDAGIKVNGRYVMDIDGEYQDEYQHTVYPLTFVGTTIHSRDTLRMSKPGFTVGTKRNEDVERPWFLREDQTITVDNDIRKMINLAKDKPETSDIVNNFLQKVIAKGKQLLGMSTTEATQTATLQMNGQLAMQILQKICQQFPPDQCKQFMSAVGKGADQTAGIIATNIASRFRQQGDVQATERLQKFLATYDQAIDALVNKITSSEQAFVDANVDGKTVTTQKAVTSKQSIISAVKRAIEGIFTGKLLRSGTLVDKQLQEKLVKFLTQAKDGIVDWGKILAAGKGKTANVDSFVPAEFREIYNMFKKELYQGRPETTAGQWGPGEVGLIILGNPITKGSTGDLQDIKTGDKFELKASRNARKGGRLSPPGLGTSAMPGVFAKIKLNYFGKNILTKLGNKSSINKSSMNQGFIKEYNSLIDRGLKIDTKKFLTDVIMAAFTDNFPTAEELSPYVDIMIDNNKIDYTKFVRTYAKFLFDRYQGSGKDKKFKNIIVFNPGTTTYTVLDSSADLDSNLVTITGGIEFGATQVPKSPQIGIA